MGNATGLVAALLLSGDPAPEAPRLPARIHRIVLHTPGGPFYAQPQMRFVFLSPHETLALWKKPTFGAHWIVWTDGSLWPRHPRPGEPPSLRPPVEAPADEAWRRRLAAQAAPVYSHVEGANGGSLGIEVAHSGRSGDPFPETQVRALAWLLRTLLEMSEGRLTLASIVGHKDLERRPAYVSGRCEHAGCAVYVDGEGRPLRRRVDPPEGIFAALAGAGMAIPRSGSEGDAHLVRAEALPPGVPRTARP
jgi:hypothetical protein